VHKKYIYILYVDGASSKILFGWFMMKEKIFKTYNKIMEYLFPIRFEKEKIEKMTSEEIKKYYEEKVMKSIKMLKKPVHSHDCKKCKYMGTIKMKNENYKGKYDLYYCPHGRPTVIARYGSSVEKYGSGMIIAEVESKCEDWYNYPLAIAYMKAKELGFVKIKKE